MNEINIEIKICFITIIIIFIVILNNEIKNNNYELLLIKTNDELNNYIINKYPDLLLGFIILYINIYSYFKLNNINSNNILGSQINNNLLQYNNNDENNHNDFII